MKDKNGLLSKLISAMRKNKKTEIAVYVTVGVCVLLLYLLATGGNGKKTEEGQVEVISATEAQIEDRLAQTLSQIRGAGKVKVMITYDTTAELVPAMSSAKQSSESKTDGGSTVNENESNELATINTGGEQEAVVLKEIQPKVRGVIVIAEGAADISVKLNLEYATATVLGIEADAIEIFEMRSDG